jgi:tetratricopeptide (TPR) repeat protein
VSVRLAAIDEAAWSAAAAQHDAALDLIDEGKLAEAEHLARSAADALARSVGREHPDTANAWCTLSRIASYRGRFADAATHAHQAIAALVAVSANPIVDAIRLSALHHLGTACTSLGRFAEAEEVLASALALATRETHEDAGAAAEIQNARGILFKFLGRHDEAQIAYDDALRRFEEAQSAPPAALLHNVAGLACARGDFAAAEALARRAIDRRREAEGECFGLAQDVAGLADALASQGRLQEAEALYRNALARLHALAPAHPEVAYLLHNLGDALVDAGRPADAEACYREAIAHKERALGVDHPEVAASQANLAALLSTQGRHGEARALAENAVAITAHLTAAHPIRAGCEAIAARLREP